MVGNQAGQNHKYRHYEWETQEEPEMNRIITPQILDAVPGFAHLMNWDIGVAQYILKMVIAKMRDEDWGNIQYL